MSNRGPRSPTPPCCWSPTTANGPAGGSTARRAPEQFAKRQAIPLYDASVVGYPQRMRDYNARNRDR